MAIDEREAVRQALAAGHLSVTDPATGHLHTIYARCPNDGEVASIRRVAREPGGGITEVRARCLRCGQEFTAAPESLHIR